ncbi:molybdenum cofactor biosynthesis protein B [Gilvimarinus sp. SDUM040013]|uniref:Molybdenum cofactor biosynthesis protein B n=1 Tax=Gilvimarinus gilvus TaxID=3058038 RepID=A0ABU4RXF4_9GAMM|nr:molybdenum cofactor biosynthesis protein B [Gilvimarinus sp. SDUM040013]MDO3388652.1 molybdenum cofactor biosynthesis protein B [Gilvimarinus sp. SDUM040013]MDX6849547.1 molybdenum cofactor biosynthesis protein B [Gilvimarinus sp. SDUM040013]
MSSNKEFIALNCAVLTVSDTRTRATDTSGAALEGLARTAGHNVAERALVQDDIYQIRAEVSRWIARADIQVVLITGGTGFAGRDSTVEAVTPLFDKTVVGFGELFRQLSYQEIGSSTIQSRATAGLANKTLMFCLPGSTGACNTAWQIIEEQLDARHGPCNFVGQLR